MRGVVYILLLFFVCASNSVSGQTERSLQIYLDTADILIGEQIKMTVEMKFDGNDQVSFPTFIDSLVDKVEVLSASKIDTSYGENNLAQKILTQRYSLTSFDSGFYVVPPIAAKVNNDSIFADPFLISVYTIRIDSTNALADIKTIMPLPLTFMDYVEAYWHIAAGVLLAILIGLALFYYFKTRKPKEKQVEEVIEITPAHVIALTKLRELEEAKLWQNNQVKEYHVKLSEIVREYIENRYHIQALEQTTSEILHHLRLSEINEEQKALLRKFLMLSDLVKFAKEEPLADENIESIKTAFGFVEATKQEVSVEEAESITTETIAV